MKITGYYTKGQNFIDIYTCDSIYTIARNTGDYSHRKVGDFLANGFLLTKEVLDELKSQCTKYGTFDL